MVELAVRLVFSLAVVIGLLLVTVKVGGQKFRPRNGALVRVVHRQALSRGTAVAVVQVGSRVLVLGTTEHQVNVLAELEEGELGEPAEVVTAPAARDDDAEVTDLDDVAARQPLPSLPKERSLAATGPLAGSVLSAETWRQAMAVATGRAS